MQNLVVIGLQWGDEGKGKLVDFISERFDIVVRFQGGSNAGHTVIVGDRTFKFRIMPTGAVRGKKVVIGNGVVVDLAVLLEEIQSLKDVGIDVDLLLSDRAHVITAYQIQIDGLQEEEKVGREVGTTKRGIGPTYSDKMSRVGVRISDLIDDNSFNQWHQMESASVAKIQKLHSSTISYKEGQVLSANREMIHLLRGYIGDSGDFLNSQISSGKRVLFEGAQGTLLDIDHGTYPFVTSSNCMSAAASTGTGVPFKKLDAVLGITKAYTTRVGTGPFPTELFDNIAERIRSQGNEFGTVTGRPRRCGWLDLVALRYAVQVNGAEHLAITKLDVLNGINPVKVCIAYELDGSELKTIPASSESYDRVNPIYEELDGWDNTDVKEFEDLPGSLREYISRIEQFVDSDAAVISIGPDRADTIDLSGNLFKDV